MRHQDTWAGALGAGASAFTSGFIKRGLSEVGVNQDLRSVQAAVESGDIWTALEVQGNNSHYQGIMNNIASLTGMAAAAAFGRDAEVGADAARNEMANNYLTHSQVQELIAQYRAARGNPQKQQDLLSKALTRSQQQRLTEGMESWNDIAAGSADLAKWLDVTDPNAQAIVEQQIYDLKAGGYDKLALRATEIYVRNVYARQAVAELKALHFAPTRDHAELADWNDRIFQASQVLADTGIFNRHYGEFDPSAPPETVGMFNPELRENAVSAMLAFGNRTIFFQTEAGTLLANALQAEAGLSGLRGGGKNPFNGVVDRVYSRIASKIPGAWGAVTSGADKLSGKVRSIFEEIGTGFDALKKLWVKDVGFDTSNLKNKLFGYLLDPAHPQNQLKADWFKQALGFDKKNWQDLASQLWFNERTAILTKTTKFGQTYEHSIPIKGSNGRTIDTTFVFMKDTDGVVRLVTGIPTKK